jgi:hypothetical protein
MADLEGERAAACGAATPSLTTPSLMALSIIGFMAMVSISV